MKHFLVGISRVLCVVMIPDSAVKPKTRWKRGAILEQRRRPTLEFQYHFGFRQVIAM